MDDTGAPHHLELWVEDLEPALRAWSWLLEGLGYAPYQQWEAGRSWRRGSFYVVVESGPAVRPGGADRLRPGMNHMAFCAGSRADVDALVAGCTAAGWSVLFPDRYPFAGGPDHYAAYLEDPQGLEVELVARPEVPGPGGAPVAGAGELGSVG